MKAGLIKLTNEDDIFYDSEDRLYRYQMHCPYCGIVSECRCFETLEKAEDFIERGISVACSIVCAPLINYIHKHGGLRNIITSCNNHNIVEEI